MGAGGIPHADGQNCPHILLTGRRRVQAYFELCAPCGRIHGKAASGHAEHWNCHDVMLRVAAH
jgi:hypothetical protein